MRFFQRRKDGMGVEQQGSATVAFHPAQNVDSKHSPPQYHHGDGIHSLRKDPFAPLTQEELRQCSNTNLHDIDDKTESTIVENEYPKNRQSIGRLVRKLNCSASRKSIHGVDQDPIAFTDRTGSLFSNEGGMNRATRSDGLTLERLILPSKSIESAASSDITRPVLITVKDRDTKQPSTKDVRDRSNCVTPEMKRSFVVGEFPVRTSSFRSRSSARKRLHDVDYHNNNLTRSASVSGRWVNNGGKWEHSSGGINSSSNSSRSNPSNSPIRTSSNLSKKNTERDLEAIRVAQDLARRERWKRGLENELYKKSSTAAGRSNTKSKGPIAAAKRYIEGESSNNTEDDQSLSDSTQGSHTTGTSGYDDTTGESSSLDEWTDGSTTDNDSRVYRYHQDYPQHQQRQYRKTKSGRRCINNEQLARSVAEDVGIFADLILSDGFACFGTAAAITKETVASCRGNDV
ncbi:unnamed protein product [Pseudo-nitzschia multistriata]|uniref:Uncharacterized protein n=1 Tax=Pseudo-nitzschia multistriata TaxID=183589 RepID=A0A448ZGY3_9STRA|nr:unnamed protein product [Pseudo-nitzschia multistriata]